jgi:hypothetical protein
MSQSLVTVMAAPIAHEGVIFFNQTLGSPSNMSEHLLGSNKGFEILANYVQNPLLTTGLQVESCIGTQRLILCFFKLLRLFRGTRALVKIGCSC